MNFSLANFFLSRISQVLIRFRFLQFLPWLVLAISLFVTYQLWRNYESEAELALQTEFDYRVQDAISRIDRRMSNYARLLQGVQGLFVSSMHVSREEFHTYVQTLNIEKNYPGIQGLSYILLIPAEKKDQHIAFIRKQGFPAYTIHPEGVRDTYTSILYIAPFSGLNLQAFGFDNYSDPLRRAAMEAARDTGLGTISSKLKLVQNIDNVEHAGFLLWMPVYKNGATHESIADRRANLSGWIGASFKMQDLMGSIFDRQEDNNLAIEIHDGKEMSDKTLMYVSGKNYPENHASSARFQSIRSLSVEEHSWTLTISSLPVFEEHLNTQRSTLIVIAGMAVSMLLAIITWILLYSRNQALKAAIALHHELIERKRAEAGMRLAEKVFETVDAAVLVTDVKNRIVKVNPAFTVITGYSAEDAIGKPTTMLSSGAHPPEFYKEMWVTLKETGSWQGEIYNRRKNGEFYTEWLSINAVYDEAGRLTNYVALFSDISERKAAEAHMHNLAHFDALTGLPNRTLLSDRWQQAIAAAKREKSHMALMFIDLDKFKPVNDTLGHHIGDLMLKEVAKRILSCLRESDSAARIGGDEFIVLLPYIEAVSDAVAVGEKIRHALNQAFELAGNTLFISSSIGVAVYPEHGGDEKILLRNADTAMYYAKETGRNNVKLYEPEMKNMTKGTKGRSAVQ